MSIGCAVWRCRNLFDSEIELYGHIEDLHHEVVQRQGESYPEAEARFLREHPEARECIKCYEASKPWARNRHFEAVFRKKAQPEPDDYQASGGRR